MEIINQQCKKCSQNFILDENDLNFYQKMKVPNPKVCPDCRFKVRAMWRNETTLYSGHKCQLCGKNIISVYNPNSSYVIYCYDCYTSDKWEARDYAMSYDLAKPFFDQVKELMLKVPKNSLNISTAAGRNINSDYINMAGDCKNCYLVFNTSPAEELMYSRGVTNGRFSLDIYFGVDFENCYECVNVQQSSGVIYGQNVNSCVDSYFILNGSGLTNCFGCVNLRMKSNCWLNEQLTKEEYAKRLKEIQGSYKKMEEFKKEFEKFVLKFPHRSDNNLKNLNSSGDYLFECKNVNNSFEVARGENSKHIFSSKAVKDSLGTIGFGTNSENLLEVVATGFSSNVIGTFWAENSQNIMYSFDVRNCQDCIGCDSLRNGKYAILNKEYSKEEYEVLKEKIINDLQNKNLHGLMMPPEIAPFAYNETIAQDNFPLKKEEAMAQGFRWEDNTQKTEGKETLKPEEVPDYIKDVVGSITNEVLRCIECNRNYKITEQELLFYKKMVLPIPRKCFYCRHQNRIIRRGPYKFWNRECMKCQKEITTNYAPDRPEIVYCEKCYQQEVY